jgi:hypothetical protein
MISNLLMYSCNIKTINIIIANMMTIFVMTSGTITIMMITMHKCDDKYNVNSDSYLLLYSTIIAMPMQTFYICCVSTLMC